MNLLNPGFLCNSDLKIREFDSLLAKQVLTDSIAQ